MPQGIRSRKERLGAFLRPCADGVRVIALGLLFLMLWAATLGPAAMAATTGIVPEAFHMQHGGETPPAQDTTTSLSSTRSSQHLRLPASSAAMPLAIPTARVSPRRHLARRLRLAVAPPRTGPPRRQHRGRAPPR